MQTVVPACKALLLPDVRNSDCDLRVSEISHFSIFKSDGPWSECKGLQVSDFFVRSNAVSMQCV